jgi:hypothetical protein
VEEARSVCGTTFSTTRTPLAYAKKLICRQNPAERNPSIIGATQNVKGGGSRRFFSHISFRLMSEMHSTPYANRRELIFDS